MNFSRALRFSLHDDSSSRSSSPSLSSSLNTKQRHIIENSQTKLNLTCSHVRNNLSVPDQSRRRPDKTCSDHVLHTYNTNTNNSMNYSMSHVGLLFYGLAMMPGSI